MKMRKICLIGVLLLTLWSNIGLSEAIISVDKSVIKCDPLGVCEALNITLTNDLARQVYIKITSDDGLLNFNNYPTLTENVFKSASFYLPVITTSFSFKPIVKPFSEGKYNISIYDALTDKILFNLDPYWIPEYQYRKNITIDNTGNNATLTDFALRFNISYVAGKMNADFSDLRFYNETGDQKFFYWIENKVNSDYADVWVNISYIEKETETTIVMYYGNPDAVSESNASRVFLIFDRFEYDTSAFWIKGGKGTGTGAIESGNFKITHVSGGSVYYYSNLALKDNYTITGYLYSTTGTPQGIQFQMPPAMLPVSDYVGIHLLKRYAPDNDLYSYNYNTSASILDYSLTSNYYEWYQFRADYFTKNLTLYFNKTKYYGSIFQNSSPTGYFAMDVLGGIAYYDNITIMKITTPTPTYNIEGEETAPNLINVTLEAPANESVTDENAVIFEFNPASPNAFVNCSLYINGVWDKANESIILNDTTNTITQTNFINQTLNWSVGCWDIFYFNMSENFTLEIAKPYPIDDAINIYDIWGDATNQYCIDNNTLYSEYREVVYMDGSKRTFNYSKISNCPYGCSNNECNKSTHETYLFYLMVFGGLLGLILLIFVLSKAL